MKTILLFVLCGLMAISCNPHYGDSDLSVTAGNWGHLETLSQIRPSKLFLSHVRKDDTYRICLANYMVEKYPGIESELKAATNIWGYYIGREIKVEIVKTDLPPASYEVDEKRLMNTYYKLCPAETHLVVGESYFNDDAAAKTIPSYSYSPGDGPREILSFKRSLFLKVPLEVGEEVDEENGDPAIVWKTLAQVTGKVFSAEQILELMKKRDQSLFVTGNHEVLTLDTIVHEFGHIWGLCDQYDMGGFTNCDPNFASINEQGHIILHDEAIMSKSSWVTKLNLSDDDIEGIRQLAERSEFSHDWPLASSFRSLVVPPIAKGKAISFAHINSAELKGMKLALNMSIVSTTQLRMKVKVLDKNSGSWIEYGTIAYDRPLKSKNVNLDLNINRYYSPVKVEVNLLPVNAVENEKIKLESNITQSKIKATTEPEEEVEYIDMSW